MYLVRRHLVYRSFVRKYTSNPGNSDLNEIKKKKNKSGQDRGAVIVVTTAAQLHSIRLELSSARVQSCLASIAGVLFLGGGGKLGTELISVSAQF